MLQVQKFTFNPFSENTYVLYNQSRQCWIIDPGMSNEIEEKEIIDFIEKNHLIPQQIINTHAHIDHILGINFLKEKYQIPFGMYNEEQFILDNAMTSALMFGIPMKATPKADFYIMENEPMQLGDDTLEVRFAPGHSPGSIVFYNREEKWLIGGDVLFQGSIGRTDLPKGDFATLEKSIKEQLYTLPDDTKVYSGHGIETTIGDEKWSNPFVRA